MCTPDVIVCMCGTCEKCLEYWYSCDGCGFDYAFKAAHHIKLETVTFLLCNACYGDYKEDRIVLYA